jgi:hypothetical protein
MSIQTVKYDVQLSSPRYAYSNSGGSGNIGHVKSVIVIRPGSSTGRVEVTDLLFGNSPGAGHIQINKATMSPNTLRTLGAVFNDLADEAERLSTLMEKARLLS